MVVYIAIQVDDISQLQDNVSALAKQIADDYRTLRITNACGDIEVNGKRHRYDFDTEPDTDEAYLARLTWVEAVGHFAYNTQNVVQGILNSPS